MNSWQIYLFLTMRKLFTIINISTIVMGIVLVFYFIYHLLEVCEVYSPSQCTVEGEKQHKKEIAKSKQNMNILMIAFGVCLIAFLLTPTPRELDILTVNYIIKQENVNTDSKTAFEIIDYIDVKAKELNDDKN